ncbi:MAG: hypothetical protein Q8L61_01360, partial [Hyphomicrobium sp.]|nr:hypothetical protein [Hyphomicrobium sp.]
EFTTFDHKPHGRILGAFVGATARTFPASVEVVRRPMLRGGSSAGPETGGLLKDSPPVNMT